MVRAGIVEIDGRLDETLPEHLLVKIDIILRAGCDRSNVVDALNWSHVLPITVKISSFVWQEMARIDGGSRGYRIGRFSRECVALIGASHSLLDETSVFEARIWLVNLGRTDRITV